MVIYMKVSGTSTSLAGEGQKLIEHVSQQSSDLLNIWARSSMVTPYRLPGFLA